MLEGLSGTQRDMQIASLVDKHIWQDDCQEKGNDIGTLCFFPLIFDYSSHQLCLIYCVSHKTFANQAPLLLLQ